VHFTSSSTSPIIPRLLTPLLHKVFKLPNYHFNRRLTMPSTFSLGTYTAILSSILVSLSLPLHLSSRPPPYNHTQSSHNNHSLHKSRPCPSQDLLIPVTPSVLIHIPNATSYAPRSAHRTKRNTQSIPMVEMVHHKAIRHSTLNA
jgi:hypothetical protein